MVDLRKFQQHVKDKSPAFVPLFKNQSRYQIAWGGAGSGKSHIVARKLLYRMLNESQVKHNFLITRS
jgi:phage terminase large subunit